MNKQFININGQNIPVNHQQFRLVLDPNPTIEDYGFSLLYVEELVYAMVMKPDSDVMRDPEHLNNLGIIFGNGLGVERNMDMAITMYERAIIFDNDLARSNLADIYRKGTNGVAVNLPKAFSLYLSCGLPYAHYRVGEFFENGWGVQQDLNQAKTYYRMAFLEGHHLAKKRLETWNFPQ